MTLHEQKRPLIGLFKQKSIENKIKAAQNFNSHIQSNYYKTIPVPVQTTIIIS